VQQLADVAAGQRRRPARRAELAQRVQPCARKPYL
jgi:hypothetical protein